MKNFFSNKYVMMVEAILMALMVVLLGAGGLNADGIEKITTLAISLTGAIDAIITFIAAIFGNNKKIEQKE